jgi:hypothetical protein
MKINISSKYKKLIVFLSILIPLISISVSLLTLPVELSLPLSFLLVVIPIFLSKFVFKYNSILIMPMPTDEMNQFAVGSCWFADNLETFEGIGLGIVYKYRSTAKDAFQMFKAWNYDQYIDLDANIRISIILEGNGRYSILIYPGERFKSQLLAKERTQESVGQNSHINVITMRYYIHLCLDYSNDKLKQKMIESLSFMEYLQFNIVHIKNDKLLNYSKRNFKLKGFSVCERNFVDSDSIESKFLWENPLEKYPEHTLDIVKRVRNVMNIK